MKQACWTACVLLAFSVLASTPASSRSHDAKDNRFGGAVYTGPPDLVTTGSFISAGGGPTTYSTRTALNTIIGPQLVDPELQTLRKQYGEAAVTAWLHTFDFAIRTAADQAASGGITLPLSSPTHTGKALFTALLQDGTDAGGIFWTGTMLDRLVSHAIHVQTMTNIDAALGAEADASYHKITNQFMYDVAVQLGLGDTVKLAPDH